MSKMIRIGLLVLCLGYSNLMLAAVPLTGRVQHMIYSRAQVQKYAAVAYHRHIASLADKGELDNNPAALQRVRRICSRLIAQAIRLKPIAAHWAWEVHITSDPDVAAYSMAGGKILVGTHFLARYKLSDNELAVVLGHEIGHVIAEHVREQVSMAASFNKSLPPRSRKVADVVSAMQSDISVYLRLQPLSRLQEMEADDIGIELAARAGIPPSAILSFYSKLARHDRGNVSIFNSHGSIAQRVRFVDSMASYAGPVYRASRRARLLPNYRFAAASH
ncbi:MAG: M48 family metallopeptidase [Gammaproteobacteria bacterium]|jgi:predicted Zn-dependent protease